MHITVRQWVRRQVQDHKLWGRRVVEIGAYNVNGGVRDLFESPWWGMDLRSGPGVDFVGDAELGIVPPFDPEVVLCLEVLEHSFHPWRILDNVGYILGEGGYFLLSCRGFDERGSWAVHPEPVDLLRFGDGVLAQWLTEAGFRSVSQERDPEGPGWLILARK